MSEPYEDDDYPESRRRDSGGSGGRTLLVVLGIVGAIVLLVVAVCGGGAYLAVRSMQQAMAPMMQMMQDAMDAQMAADDFLLDLKDGRVDAAYANTTEAFKKRMTEKELRDLVSKNPGLKQYQSGSLVTPMISSTAITCRSTIYLPAGGQLSCSVKLVKDGEQWKVDLFTIP